MSTRTLLAMTLAAALFATGCAKKEEPKVDETAAPAAPVVDLAAEEQAIRNRSGEWMNYANSRDAASIAGKIFAADGMLIADEKAHKGTAAIQGSFATTWAKVDGEWRVLSDAGGENVAAAAP